MSDVMRCGDAHVPDGQASARHHPRRRALLVALAGSIAPRAFAQGTGDFAGFPERPMTLYCPWTAGGPTDIAFRALADALSRHFGGRRVLIENKPGAGGALGAQFMAANAKPDGYTLAQTPLGVFRLPHMVKTGFNPVTDLSWILNVAGYHFAVFVRADSPWKTWQDMIAYARANPGRLTYGSPGVGTSLHVTMEDIAGRESIRWVQVPFKGTADSTTALRGAQVDAVAGSPPWELVDAGQMRVLVTWSENRNPRAREVPTLKEIYGIVANSPWGIAGPKGMDPRLVRFLHDAFRKAMEDPLFPKVLERIGQEPYYMSTDDYAAFARRTYEEERLVVERLGLKP